MHHIQPEAVAEYIENFIIQQSEIEFQLDGVKYDIKPIDILMSDKISFLNPTIA